MLTIKNVLLKKWMNHEWMFCPLDLIEKNMSEFNETDHFNWIPHLIAIMKYFIDLNYS